MIDSSHIVDAKLDSSESLLKRKCDAVTGAENAVHGVKVASTVDAALSTVSDTTTSKTCLCKACRDPVNPATQQSRQLTGE